MQSEQEANESAQQEVSRLRDLLSRQVEERDERGGSLAAYLPEQEDAEELRSEVVDLRAHAACNEQLRVINGLLQEKAALCESKTAASDALLQKEQQIGYRTF